MITIKKRISHNNTIECQLTSLWENQDFILHKAGEVTLDANNLPIFLTETIKPNYYELTDKPTGYTIYFLKGTLPNILKLLNTELANYVDLLANNYSKLAILYSTLYKKCDEYNVTCNLFLPPNARRKT